ncbi:MAG: radical SAM protein [bacterium]|nr:radical SAM protein [bacterium]
MTLDAIIIADSGSDSLSGTNPLKLKIEDRTADIQVVKNFLAHDGKIQVPIQGDQVASWGSAPKLNGIYLANFLTSSNFNVELIDSFYSEKDRFHKLLANNPRTVVISTTFIPGKQSFAKLVSDIRDLAPDITIIAGGPLVYMSYLMHQRSQEKHYDTQSAKNDFFFLEVKNEPAVDLYIISVRGEQILHDVLDKIRNNERYDDIPNSARLVGNTYSFTRLVDDSSNLEGTPLCWSDLPDTIYDSGVVPMQASTGCPYHCSFCNFTKDRRQTWIKPVDRIVAEMKAVKKRGARYVWFVDDNFRLGKGDLEAVCRRFIDENLELNWMTFIRASTLESIDPEILSKAGCIEVQLGLESADKQVLKNMNKKATPELYEGVLKKLISAGINCSCYYIFGFPGETEESAQRTRDFIKQFDSAHFEGSIYWSMFPFLLTPLSPIYEPRARRDFSLTGYLHEWQHATMNSEQAKDQVLKTFFEVENCGPIYRGDNQDLLRNLGPVLRKKFGVTRHRLSKLALTGKLDKALTLESFKAALCMKN